jgi:aspartate racemase
MVGHIGIVGVSAPGAALCFESICLLAPELLGPHAHPEVSMHVLNFADHVAALRIGDWEKIGEMLLTSARKLHEAKADFVVCPDNTVHVAFEAIAPRLPLPWLHIVDAIAAEASRLQLRRVGLLGTRALVESDVYDRRLALHRVEPIRPTSAEREALDALIFGELCCGRVTVHGRDLLRRICRRLADYERCDGVILGCTELPLLVDATAPLAIPALDSTRLLALAAVTRAVRPS